MQGELGTSHAYEYGGDYPPKRRYQLGRLGVDLEWDVAAKRYVIRRLYAGDPWRSKLRSPLCEPGLNVREGDYLCAIGGVPLDEQTSPGELLLHQAEQMVPLTLQHPEKDEKPRIFTVRTLRSERAARYRDWVEGNRRLVAEQTAGRVGYLHIPDMSTPGSRGVPPRISGPGSPGRTDSRCALQRWWNGLSADSGEAGSSAFGL